MGGIAEKEDIAAAPALRDLGPEGVLGDANEFELIVTDLAGPRRDERPQRAHRPEVVGRLAGEQPKLPAIAHIADLHEGPRSMGITELMDAGPLTQVSRGGDVDYQPALVKSQVAHRDSDAGSDQAVGAVAAQHVIGGHGVGVTVCPVAEGDAGASRSEVDEVGDFDIAFQRSQRVALQVRAQQRLELRLVEHIGLGMAVARSRGVTLEFGEHCEPGIEQSQAQGGSRDLGEFLGDSEPVHDPVDLVVEMYGPRLGVHLRPAVQYQGLDAVLGEQCGGGDAGGSGADDHYPIRLVHHDSFDQLTKSSHTRYASVKQF